MTNRTNFLALLKGGAKPDSVAKTFTTAFTQLCNEADEISWAVVADFINNCFDAINFKLQVTAEDVKDHMRHFPWPIAEMKSYVFLYEKTSFKRVEQFLFKICQKINSLTEDAWHKQNSLISTDCLPIQWFMQLIAIWEKTCQQLRNLKKTKYFNEPIARIDYQLLRGFQSLRKKYRNDFPILDSVCGRLLDSVLLGIFYPETYTMLISGLNSILHEDFHLFYKELNRKNNFYEIVLTAELPRSFHKELFISLLQLLETYCLSFEELTTDDQQRQKSLDVTNFLISPNMLDVYYHYLTQEGNKFVIISLLDFLLLLQSKLAALDCFPETFMEAVLSIVLDYNAQIGDLSAKFYVTVMKRRYNDEYICNSCIMFYFTKRSSQLDLFPYIKKIWKYMGLAQNMDNFVKPLTLNEKANEKYRIWAANFLNALFQYMLEDYETNRLRIIQLLQKVIRVLQSTKCLITQSTLLDIFNIIDAYNIPNKSADLKKVFLAIETCAEEKFLSFEDWQYPLLKKWFLTFEKVLKYSDSPKRIEEVALTVSHNCIDIIGEIEAQQARPLKANDLQTYSCALQKLCIVIQSGYDKLEGVNGILNILRQNLLVQSQTGNRNGFKIYCNKSLIDVYAMELYVTGLVESFDVFDWDNNAWIIERAEELEFFLKNWLQNSELLKQPIARIKTYFNCLLGLYIALGSSSEYNVLCLSTTYDFLVRTLVHVLFKSTSRKQSFSEYAEYTEVHPLNSLLYEKSMIKYFTELHSIAFTKIIDHSVWQICLHFAIAAKFQKELYDLMFTLAQKNFDIFKRVIPIVIYNLYKQQPPLSDKVIVKAIIAHKSFIDNLNIEHRGLFNCNVVLEVIGLVSKALNIRTTFGRLSVDDRLAPLKHLKIFLNNLELTSEIYKVLQREIETLRKKPLRAAERRTLSDFSGDLKQPSTEDGTRPVTPKRPTSFNQ